MKVIYTDEFNEFWAAWPKKDAKPAAGRAYAKINKKDRALIAEDIKTRYINTERKFIPNPASYLNGQYWNNEKPDEEGQPKERVKLPECKKEGCTAEVHGQGYPFCGDHLPPPETPVLKMMRKHYKDSGMMQREGESDRCHSLRLRKQYMKTMFNSLHPPIKPMDEFK